MAKQFRYCQVWRPPQGFQPGDVRAPAICHSPDAIFGRATLTFANDRSNISEQYHMIVKRGMLQSMRRLQMIVVPIARVDHVRVNPTTEICNCGCACDPRHIDPVFA
jgi:hypothetical protein